MVYKNKIHEPSGTIKYIKDFSSVILSLPNYNTSVLSTRSTALVTGGSSGLGFELAMELAKRVNKVIVADIQSFPTFAQEECNNIFYYQ